MLKGYIYNGTSEAISTQYLPPVNKNWCKLSKEQLCYKKGMWISVNRSKVKWEMFWSVLILFLSTEDNTLPCEWVGEKGQHSHFFPPSDWKLGKEKGETHSLPFFLHSLWSVFWKQVLLLIPYLVSKLDGDRIIILKCDGFEWLKIRVEPLLVKKQYDAYLFVFPSHLHMHFRHIHIFHSI